MDLCEFEASLVYTVSSRTGSKSYRETLSQKNQKPKQTKNNQEAEASRGRKM